MRNESQTISTRLANGKEIVGSYEIRNGLISVSHKGMTKKTQLGSMPPHVLAKMILAEFPRDEKSGFAAIMRGKR